MNWLIAANSLLYEHSRSFEDYKYIDWRQGKVKFKKNDVIYIYCGKPIQKILFKCLISQINLSFKEIRDDKGYWLNLDEYEKALKGKFMKLALIEDR